LHGKEYFVANAATRGVEVLLGMVVLVVVVVVLLVTVVMAGPPTMVVSTINKVVLNASCVGRKGTLP
jgi:uncharacterized membrane protein